MPSSYHYPVWLLTVDEERNNSLADIFENDLDLFTLEKTEFYDSLAGTQYHHKALYSLLQIHKLATMMLIRLFRANLNILHSHLPQMDILRLKDKTKATLSAWRLAADKIVHPLDNNVFLDVERKGEKWDAHPKLALEASEPVDWNGIVLSRLSDIHRTLQALYSHGEARILVGMNKGPFGDQDQDLGRHIQDSVLPAVQEIANAFYGYLRFVNSL